MENVLYSVAHHDGKFIIVTNKDNCRNFKIMITDVNQSSVDNWKEFLPYDQDIYIKGVDELQNNGVITIKPSSPSATGSPVTSSTTSRGATQRCCSGATPGRGR